MLYDAFVNNHNLKSVEDILNEIYKQKIEKFIEKYRYDLTEQNQNEALLNVSEDLLTIKNISVPNDVHIILSENEQIIQDNGKVIIDEIQLISTKHILLLQQTIYKK